MIEYENGSGGGGNPTRVQPAASRPTPRAFPGGGKPSLSGPAPSVDVTRAGGVEFPVLLGPLKKRPRKPKFPSGAQKLTRGSGRHVAKRTAPKGGLDLKKLSRSWRAAGKPGRWIDWVKAKG